MKSPLETVVLENLEALVQSTKPLKERLERAATRTETAAETAETAAAKANKTLSEVEAVKRELAETSAKAEGLADRIVILQDKAAEVVEQSSAAQSSVEKDAKSMLRKAEEAKTTWTDQLGALDAWQAGMASEATKQATGLQRTFEKARKELNDATQTELAAARTEAAQLRAHLDSTLRNQEQAIAKRVQGLQRQQWLLFSLAALLAILAMMR